MMSRGKSIRQKLSPDFWIEAGLDPDGFKKKFISRYKGFGVFSQKKSKTGDFLLEYEGELLRGQNIQGRQLQHEVSNQRRERRGGIPRCFMFHFKYNGKKMCLDATYSRERLGHFVNDAKKNQTSCNAKMKLRTYKHRPRLLLFGTQDVAIGEEISFDYGDDNNLWWRKEGAEEYSSESDSEVPRKRAKLPKKKWTLEEKAALRKLVDKATIEQKPPRKAEIQKRFGNALVPTGSLELKKKIFADDYRPIDESCKCCTCRQYTRAYLHTVVQSETVACQLVSVHNVAYQLELMRSVRQSIVEGRFPEFIQKFFKTLHPDGKYPKWAVEALEKVNVKLVCQLVQNGVKSESECLET